MPWSLVWCGWCCVTVMNFRNVTRVQVATQIAHIGCQTKHTQPPQHSQATVTMRISTSGPRRLLSRSTTCAHAATVTLLWGASRWLAARTVHTYTRTTHPGQEAGAQHVGLLYTQSRRARQLRIFFAQCELRIHTAGRSCMALSCLNSMVQPFLSGSIEMHRAINTCRISTASDLCHRNVEHSAAAAQPVTLLSPPSCPAHPSPACGS